MPRVIDSDVRYDKLKAFRTFDKSDWTTFIAYVNHNRDIISGSFLAEMNQTSGYCNIDTLDLPEDHDEHLAAFISRARKGVVNLQKIAIKLTLKYIIACEKKGFNPNYIIKLFHDSFLDDKEVSEDMEFDDIEKSLNESVFHAKFLDFYKERCLINFSLETGDPSINEKNLRRCILSNLLNVTSKHYSDSNYYENTMTKKSNDGSVDFVHDFCAVLMAIDMMY